MLPLHHVKTFAAVAAERSFSRAAETLHVSQPAVSRAVRELEAHIGTPLIDRGPGPFRLTAAGALLERQARDIFGAAQAAERALADLRGLATGGLAIGASTTIANHHLPPILAAYHRAHPAIALRQVVANTETIAERLLAHDIDVALVEGPTDNPRLIATPWRTEALILIAAPAAAAAWQTRPVIVREPGSGTRAEATRALAAIGHTPSRTLEAGSTEAIKHWVAEDLGVAILPEAACADLIATGRLVALRTAATRTLSRLTRPGHEPGFAERALNAHLANRHKT